MQSQENVLKYRGELTPEQLKNLKKDLDDASKLIAQKKLLIPKNDLILSIDFNKSSLKNSNIQIIKYFQMEQASINLYELEGLKAISDGRVAIIALAGGLSTRLSISYPKGIYSVDLLSSKSLFQIQAERIIRIKNLAYQKYPRSGISIPWYIMTSDHTHQATLEFFNENDYFGLCRTEVVLFKQDSFPALDIHGNLTLFTKYSINKLPDGNGGLYKALVSNNILSNMSQRGVKFIHVYGVENILVKIADPLFTGYCIKNSINCSAKVVRKSMWNEPVNRLCFIENKLRILDYSLLNKQSIQILLDSDDNSSIFSLGDIGYYFLEIDLLKKLCSDENQIPVNKFNRNLNFLDLANGKQKKQNCVVFEKFLTDLFPGSLTLFEVDRATEFSPLIYMSTGQPFNRYACKKNLMKLHFSWLIHAGARFNQHNAADFEIKNLNYRHDESSADDIPDVCEVSPLVSYSGEGLEEFVKGRVFEPPLVLEMEPITKQVTFNGLDLNSFKKLYKIEHPDNISRSHSKF